MKFYLFDVNGVEFLVKAKNLKEAKEKAKEQLVNPQYMTRHYSEVYGNMFAKAYNIQIL